MVFLDRADAGRRLALALEAWRGQRPIVFAIPRGAVPMGKIVADALGGELDVPEGFYAVGQFYRDFRQVDDAEVVALLRTAGRTDREA